MSDKDRRRRPLELRAASADGCTGTSDMSLRRLKGADLYRDVGEIPVPAGAHSSGAPGNLVTVRALCYCFRRGRNVEFVAMSDYSLHSVATRPAEVGDKLVTTQFANCLPRGFSAIGETNLAVCLLAGTEVAFESEIEFEGGYGIFRNWKRERKAGGTVARFRQISVGKPHVHHDALEFPGGKIVMLTRLIEGQHATVLQLPATPQRQVQDHNPASLSLDGSWNMEPRGSDTEASR